MRTKRRFLSLLLCSAMLFSLCAPSANAEAQSQESGRPPSIHDQEPEHSAPTITPQQAESYGKRRFVPMYATRKAAVSQRNQSVGREKTSAFVLPCAARRAQRRIARCAAPKMLTLPCVKENLKHPPHPIWRRKHLLRLMGKMLPQRQAYRP